MLANPFLRDLTPHQYELVSVLFDRVEVPARTKICRQGGVAIYLYCLLEGGISLQYKPYDGPRITLTQLHAGDVFGWSAVIGNPTYTSDAVSKTPVQALRVRGAALRELSTQHPAAGAQVLEKLAAAVAPRWIHSREQVQAILRREVLLIT
jgi:CRP-like cAMP-binding protein